ncbi:MAG: hypothetical protein HZC40_17520 [Chloroflexi bacterium]|nr:hypothetical protein [Chloroflexota bacterium]
MIASRPWRIGSLAHWLIGLSALALGALSALGSSEWLAFAGVALAILIAAFTLPFTLAAPLLAVFAAAQFYFSLPGTAFTLRGALLFVVALAARRWGGLSSPPKLKTWMFPAALFLCAAFIAALDATNRYSALKGVYDWLAIFLTAFVASEIVASQQTLTRVVRASIAVGIAQALLGLAQAAFSVDQVVAALRLPVNDFFFQPDLLRERLDSLAFNWILVDRVAPFGNFINAIDYAIFLAAIVPLGIAIIVNHPERSEAESKGIASQKSLAMTTKIILFAGIVAMIAAILLTLKASGIFALGAASATLGIFILPRLSARARVIIITFAFVALALAVPFAGAISECGSFLIARELGANTATGRLAVWAQLIAALPQRALVGFGLNNALDLIAPTPTLNGGAFAFTQPAPESGYVAALIETGLIGFSALISLFALTLARASRNARTFKNPIHVGILAAIVALLIGNLTVAGFTADQNGMLLGMLIGIVVRDWTRSVEIGA